MVHHSTHHSPFVSVGVLALKYHSRRQDGVGEEPVTARMEAAVEHTRNLPREEGMAEMPELGWLEHKHCLWMQ